MGEEIECRRIGDPGRETSGRRNDCSVFHCGVMLASSLIVHKEEKLVAVDWTAESAAKHCAVEGRPGRTSQLGTPGVCIQVLIFSEEESIAMELIGSALGNHH